MIKVNRRATDFVTKFTAVGERQINMWPVGRRSPLLSCSTAITGYQNHALKLVYFLVDVILTSFSNLTKPNETGAPTRS
jgi:hypothetical protein